MSQEPPKEFIRITEQVSPYRHLEKMSVMELLTHINNEDKTVPFAVEKALPQIDAFVQATADKMLSGGRLFYIGAGTSGRLGVVDASECPPTFGVPPELITGVIAGGAQAILNAVEYAEDDEKQGWADLQDRKVSEEDVVLGIAASGATPYVLGALKTCSRHGILTGSISCNPNAPVSGVADFPMEIVVGPEFVTGSTRMKSGTAQKLVLNMISTSLMIMLGRVEDNRMVNMQLTNEKLVDRGVKMLMERAAITDYELAKSLLLRHKSVKKSLEAIQSEQARITGSATTQ